MLKTKEEIEKEFEEEFKNRKVVGERTFKDYCEYLYLDILDYIHQIRQDDLKEVKKIIKEKGLHLGYKNDILDKLDNLNK